MAKGYRNFESRYYLLSFNVESEGKGVQEIEFLFYIVPEISWEICEHSMTSKYLILTSSISPLRKRPFDKIRTCPLIKNSILATPKLLHCF